MDRKESIKMLLGGSISLPFLKFNKSSSIEKAEQNRSQALSESMHSNWSEWPDMPWVGPAFWGNRLQDWRLIDGNAECTVTASNRSLHSLTHQLDRYKGDFKISVQVNLSKGLGSRNGYVGFRIGAKAKDDPCPVTFEDYRRAAIYGEGLDAGISSDGRLIIGEERSNRSVATNSAIHLELKGEAVARAYRLVLTAFDAAGGERLDRLTVQEIPPENVVGNIALVSHFPSEGGAAGTPSARFSDWRISGSKISGNPDQTFGPVLFSQYTLNQEVLKVTAQLAPMETISGHGISFQIREGKSWKTLRETTVHPLARTAHFRLEKWSYDRDIPYRLRVELPLKNGTKEYFYKGTIAADPVGEDRLKAAVFSCNQEHGFPDTEVVKNVAKHRPHMAMFLGDQFYESFGGFGVERSHNLEKATLDYLRKWYQFGWSYRDIFRDIPSVFIPDDHDVFHGNIWGEGGKAADVSQGFGSESQDTGGYKMPAEWVDMVQRTQTSHLPDPYDPTPIKQDIGVYYTDWIYGGISFAIIEDRKFKTAPSNVLPVEVDNGFVQDPEFDFSEYYDIDAELLGERQEKFLEEWVADWSRDVQMKVVLSQSPFCGAHTMPEGVTSDRIVPRRPIPRRGEYPEGDVPAPDMDTNGWPAKKREKAVRIIRKGFALHIAGDQHLASMIQYGLDEYRDSNFVYTLPALNNTWPRRWWPTTGEDHKPLPGRPRYTGDFRDAFNNRITMLAAANPVQTDRVPAIIYDRVTGYGIVHFNKPERTARLECWPRYVDPLSNPEGQYDGWPLVVRQQDNYGRKAAGYLPEIRIEGMQDPVIQVFNQANGELEYALRIKGTSFRPKIFANIPHKVRVGDPDRNLWQEFENLRAGGPDKSIRCIFT